MITNINDFKKINESSTIYNRVVPRDFFNEAKLLKCMGQLCLFIHNDKAPVEMKVEHDGSPFQILMLLEGALTVSNVIITIKGIHCIFKTTYNSKSNYPFFVSHEYNECPVFNDQGQFDEEFIEFCNTL